MTIVKFYVDGIFHYQVEWDGESTLYFKYKGYEVGTFELYADIYYNGQLVSTTPTSTRTYYRNPDLVDLELETENYMNKLGIPHDKSLFSYSNGTKYLHITNKELYVILDTFIKEVKQRPDVGELHHITAPFIHSAMDVLGRDTSNSKTVTLPQPIKAVLTTYYNPHKTGFQLNDLIWNGKTYYHDQFTFEFGTHLGNGGLLAYNRFKGSTRGGSLRAFLPIVSSDLKHINDGYSTISIANRYHPNGIDSYQFEINAPHTYRSLNIDTSSAAYSKNYYGPMNGDDIRVMCEYKMRATSIVQILHSINVNRPSLRDLIMGYSNLETTYERIIGKQIEPIQTNTTTEAVWI